MGVGRLPAAVRAAGRYLAAPATAVFVGLIAVVYLCQLAFGYYVPGLAEVRHILSLSIPDLHRGQWWRVATTNLTNGPLPPNFGPSGFSHFASNAAFLLGMGPAVERGLGRARYLMLLVVSGVAAYAWLVIPNPGGIYQDGTSTIVYGVGAALLVLSVRRPPKGVLPWALLALLAVAGVIGVVTTPEVTKELHSGGFLAGLVFSVACLVPRSRGPGYAVGTAVVVGVVVLLAIRVPQLAVPGNGVGTPVALNGLPESVATDGGRIVVMTERPASVGILGGWSHHFGSESLGAITVADGSVWVTDLKAGKLTRLGPEGRTQVVVRLSKGAFGLTSDRGYLWVEDANAGRLWRIDPRTNRVTARVRTGARGDVIAAQGGDIWLADTRSKSLVKVSESGLRVSRAHVGIPVGVLTASRQGQLWLATGDSSPLGRFDTKSNRVVLDTRLPGAQITALAVGPNQIWADDFRGNIFALDPNSGRVVERIRLGLLKPNGLVLDDGSIWTIAFWQDKVVKVSLR